MKKASFKGYLVACLTLAMVLAFAAPSGIAHATDLCVDPVVGVCGYTSLQAAIAAAASGDTINIHAGTYNETGQIVINKNLTIVGADKLTTIITPAQDTGNTSSGDARGWFLVQPGFTFNLSNVTLDGAGRRVAIAILSRGPGVINNNIIKNIGYTIDFDNDNLYFGRGIQLYDTNMTVSNNTLQNIERIGIFAFGTGVTAAVIDGNTYTGKGEGDWLDYGIELGGGAVAQITNNTISECVGVAYDASTSAGILATTYFAPGTSGNIHNNSLLNNSAGIAVGYDASDTTSVTAYDNILSGNDVGIASTAPTVNAISNYWGSASPDWSTAIDGPVAYNPWYNDDTLTTKTYGVGASETYTTIQSAITAASAGDTVQVAAGTYVEELTIDKSLTLLGPNANINPNTGVRVAEAILLPANIGLDIGGPCTKIINLSGVLEEVTVKGFTVDGNNPALHSGVFINGIETAACQGIAGRNNLSGIVVENNIIKNVIHSAVYMRNLDTPGPTSGNYIRYNKIENLGTVGKPYGYGVIVQNNFYADITDNVITAARTGIQTTTFNSANPGTTGSISNNTINAWRSGIFHYHWYSTASSIAVANNTITPMAHSGAGWWNGIVLADFGTTGSTTVVDNTITVAPGFTFIDASYSAGYNVISDSPTIPLTISGGTVTGADYGVFVNNYEGYPDLSGGSDPTSIVIDGVTLLNSGIAGVYVKDSAFNTTGATVFANVQNSTIDSAGTGILIDGADASAQANYNRIAGNPTAGVTNPNTAVMDAQDNWWGVASGPAGAGTGSGDAVSANVDFQPWCVDADCLASTPFTTTTSISSDLPDPSSRGNLVTIQVSVTNNAPGGQVPAGTVDVSDGTNEICSNIALSAGTGSCTYNFPTSGIFTLSATFTPADTALFSSSTGTASHRVVSKPILLSPANAAQLLYNRPTFDWTDVSNANSYKIQVARDSGFTDRIINTITSTSSYKPANPLPAGVTLYWRARVETPFVSKWSKVFTLTTAKPPSVPSLFLPANGAVLSDTTPVLDWSNSTVPAGTTFDHYQLQVYTNPGSPKSSLVLQKTRLGSIYTFGVPLAPGTYYWRVRSYNSDGQYSEWSQVWSFTIQP